MSPVLTLDIEFRHPDCPDLFLRWQEGSPAVAVMLSGPQPWHVEGFDLAGTPTIPAATAAAVEWFDYLLTDWPTQ
jgi:hypothetical protein